LNAQISPDEIQNYSIPISAQNMALLRAPTNTNSSFSKTALNSPILVDNQAIAHENRPIILARGDNTNPSEEIFSSDPSDQISIYVVHEGDNLPDIAKMFNVSVNTIRWANNLDSKTPLKNDQELIILPISGVKYVVKKGDTLKSIATSYKGDVNEILAYNGIESLNVGDEIIIPNGEVGVAISTNTNKNSKKSSGPKNLASRSINNGYFTRPVIGGIKTQGIHGHNGVDLANSLGSPIIAAASGKVIVAKQGGWNGGYGNMIVISHSNGMQTLYGHLNSVKVNTGEQVNKGDVIGGMGNTGDSSGVHLHFEVRGGTNPF